MCHPKAHHFSVWAAPKDPTFSVWAAPTPPQIFSEGLLPKPSIFEPSMAHIYHFQIHRVLPPPSLFGRRKFGPLITIKHTAKTLIGCQGWSQQFKEKYTSENPIHMQSLKTAYSGLIESVHERQWKMRNPSHLLAPGWVILCSQFSVEPHSPI